MINFDYQIRNPPDFGRRQNVIPRSCHDDQISLNDVVVGKLQFDRGMDDFPPIRQLGLDVVLKLNLAVTY